MKSLVIVESPAKAKTISKYLNECTDLVKKYGKFYVIASLGHIRDLKQKDLSVDIDNAFTPIYEVIPTKKKLVGEILTKVKESDNVFLASDSDLEGHAIAWHIMCLCQAKDKSCEKKCKRIIFTEITKRALHDAVCNAKHVDFYKNKVCAQQARRVLDRLLGFKLSPLLWKTYQSNGIGLSAGRVQSAVLKILVDKEAQVGESSSECYWSVYANFDREITDARLYDENGVVKFNRLEHMKSFLEFVWRLRQNFVVGDIQIKKRSVAPPKPFTTSTLQQEAYGKMGSSIKRTMKIAQDLYEKGYITYMRTDSTNISQDASTTIRSLIEKNYGADYIKDISSGVSGVNKHAQEAHECIRPSDFTKTAQIGIDGFLKEHVKLYQLIFSRTIASLMKPALYEDMNVCINNDEISQKYGSAVHFKGTFTQMMFDGWQRAYEEKRDEDDKDATRKKTQRKKVDVNAMAKSLQKARMTMLECSGRNTWTSPPARFNESSIIKYLDVNGIGRPATYSAILTKLYDKRYVDKKDIVGDNKEATHLGWTKESNGKITVQKETISIGQEKSRLVPTEVGTEINRFLTQHFPFVVEKEYTADMENELDKVAEGETSYEKVMKTFWKPLREQIESYDKVHGQKDGKNKGKKVALQTGREQKIISLSGVDYKVTTTRYGPAVAFKNNSSGKTEYKDLKQYLRVVGKSIDDVVLDDIKFVVNIPYDFKNGYVLKIGPYGFYLQRNGSENANVPYSFLKKLDDMNMLLTMKKDELGGFFEFKKKSATISKSG